MSSSDMGQGFAYSELAASERNALLMGDIKDLEQDRANLQFRIHEIEEQLRVATIEQDTAFSSLRADRDALLRAIANLREQVRQPHANPSDELERTNNPRGPVPWWRTPESQEVSKLRIAAVMDEFTTHAFVKACKLFPLSVDNWASDIDEAHPDVLFVESAWEGNGGLWHGKVNHLSPELIELVSYCKSRSIPTVFWNKEDPVHYNSFVSTASIFDFVFTTDFDSIEAYRRTFQHDNVFVLPFFCEPMLHGPIQTVSRRSGFSFAGTYYARYPERQKNFEAIIDATSEFGDVSIYDRKHGGSDPAFVFPDKYKSLIRGSLPFAEVDKSYKGFDFGINLNSVKQSQTMYARRVLDLMVSNTHVVSNYSRGLRLMFGDLVIASDDVDEIKRQVRSLLDDQDRTRTSAAAAYVRLLALRKVLREHTTANRLEYMAEKIWGGKIKRSLPWVRLVAFADTDEALGRFLKIFQDQSWSNKRMTVVLTSDVNVRAIGNQEGVEFARQTDAEALVGSSLSEDCVAFLSAEDAYGPDYIQDLALGFLYSDAEVVGKSEQARPEVFDRSKEYTWTTSVPVRSSICRVSSLGDMSLADWLRDCDSAVFAGDKVLAVDPFNYVRNAPLEAAVFQERVHMDIGRSMRSIHRAAETITRVEESVVSPSGLHGEELAQLFHDRSRNKLLSLMASDVGLEIRSEMPSSKHAYVYASEHLPLARLAQGTDSLTIHAVSTAGLNISVVVVYFDSQANRMDHAVLRPNENHTVEIPPGAATVLFGVRAQGSGVCTLRGISLEAMVEPVSHTPRLIRPKKLILTNVYPSSSALYRNGFIHSRVKGYEAAGVECEVFCLNPRATPHSYEFEGVDVHVGAAADLVRFLEPGHIDHLLVHFLDRNMWPVVADFAKSGRVTIWIHGAEVQPWFRRDFNYANDAERAEAKIASEVRMELWRKVFQDVHPNVHFVFVSEYFANEVMEDVGVQLIPSAYSIVHNYIDTNLFDFTQKAPEQRFRILSIRPFASRKYANDLTVEAIRLLSSEDFFGDLDIRIIGDGALFEETLEPLREYKNVVLEKRFLSRTEIAAIHKNYGIFLTPTRMDSQGVSRDESMSSGLVPVTTAVTAIPEFVDPTCGILSAGEDAAGMAAGMARLVRDPDVFLAMSSAAAQRVRRQSAYEQTIGTELRMIQ